MSSLLRDKRFLAPRHWPVWLILGLHRVLVLLPWWLQRRLGRAVGWMAYRIAHTRRKVARANIDLAFAQHTDDYRDHVLREHFANLGIGLFEIGMAWWARDSTIAGLCDVSGLEHLSSADEPEATLLVAGHFTSLDMLARGLGLYARFDAVHRPLGIPLVDAFMRRGRLRATVNLIDKHAPRALLKSLRDGRTVWIAVDQADTTPSGIQAGFFGHAAPTNTTVPRLAAKSDVKVVPVSCIRQADGRFRITLEPPLQGLGDDIAADAARLNRMVERHALAAPAQYYWIHRRYKHT